MMDEAGDAGETGPTDAAERDERFAIVHVALCEKTVARRSPEVEHERAVAIYDLVESNSFRPLTAPPGPYRLRLKLPENNLIFDIRDAADIPLVEVPVPMMPFRRIVKDYFRVCESYYEAIKTLPPSKIEAIDMGRRGVHDEGAVMLRDRLDGQIAVDFNTARRLFTLLCVLHIKG